ncbi:hypothetical protein TraAM80_09200 [Trypanosoma rangeli]|uniref:Uncharacterized protein n=1 Tax=Trypanosoma rangeli TaxID=5698 RepID=A0A3R7N737_TRYRA|nr:uncharacterized protein TraAM80_09200 [Trypanosoma rangeli]RNE97684.1 hypothetical protein TraAM80_09200 [Trypanosoma rangeli]|eukprot:RNE97684.1 hypothetical protein TraAM80_09200 [Trypanosoma rangeli]
MGLKNPYIVSQVKPSSAEKRSSSLIRHWYQKMAKLEPCNLFKPHPNHSLEDECTILKPNVLHNAVTHVRHDEWLQLSVKLVLQVKQRHQIFRDTEGLLPKGYRHIQRKEGGNVPIPSNTGHKRRGMGDIYASRISLCVQERVSQEQRMNKSPKEVQKKKGIEASECPDDAQRWRHTKDVGDKIGRTPVYPPNS